MARSGTLRVAATWSDARLRRGMKKTGTRMQRWATETSAKSSSNFKKGFARMVGQSGDLFPKVGRAAAPVIAAGVAIATASFNAFRKFDTGMRRIWTVLPGVQKSAIDKMGAQIEAFSKRTGHAMEDVQRATYQAISAGTVPARKMAAFWETAGQVAHAGSLEMVMAANVLTGTERAFEKSALNFAQIGDKLAAGSIKGKITITELAAAIATSGPIFASVGGDLDEFIAYMTQLTATGLPAQEAATQIKSLAGEMLREDTKLNRTLKDLTGKTFPALRREGWSVHDMVEELNRAYDRSIIKTGDLATRKEALSAFLVLFNDDVGGVAKTIKELSEAEGDLAAQSKKMADGAEADWSRTKEIIKGAFLEIGPDVAKFVNDYGPQVAQGFGTIMGAVAGGMDAVSSFRVEIENMWNTLLGDNFDTAIEKQKKFNEEFRRLSVVESRIMYENAAQAASTLGMSTGDFWRQHGDDFAGDLTAPFTIMNRILDERAAPADPSEWGGPAPPGSVLSDTMAEHRIIEEMPAEATRWSARRPPAEASETRDVTRFASPSALSGHGVDGGDLRIVVMLDGTTLADKWVEADDLDAVIRVAAVKSGG